ncbi:MAG: phosphoribosylamine--glycine ligase [Chloroflexi bacterium]|nr:phosphoribosylamine--glycine ligase [Chloroflexota bacterium]
MTSQPILIIGSGGREHALAWALARSPHVSQIWVTPGNGGMNCSAASGVAACQSVAIKAHEIEKLIDFAIMQGVGLVVVGPEQPLADGVVDRFRAAGLPIFGPSQAAVRLESSKTFAKDFMVTHGIPTAAYASFEDIQQAGDWLHAFGRPVVVKADGLAAGKGVLVCDTVEDANAALRLILEDRQFGAAGNRVVIEERLSGKEFSVLAFSDGKTVAPMVVARDHKRALDGDLGLNTGGMGAIAPAPDITPAQIEQVCHEIFQRTLEGMAAQGTPYIGVLYAGLMQTAEGMRVLEFNCRFGDPETQVILPLLETDLYEVLLACVEGRLHEIKLRWKAASCATVVLASGGYPGDYAVGKPISGLDAVGDDAMVFHAGTALESGQLVTAGGRVLAVTALGPTLDAALQKSYAAIDRIHFEGMHFRQDIGRGVEVKQ